MNPAIKLREGDVADATCDVLLLKHADCFHGADAYVAGRIGFEHSPKKSEWMFWPGRGLGAQSVLFGGVGPLTAFRYEAIRGFAQAALEEIARHRPEARKVACTLHGSGYGLDEKEAFQSLLAGLLDGAPNAPNVKEVEIVEMDSRRVDRLKQLLLDTVGPSSAEIIRPNFSSFGAGSERKARLFVAMPFSNDFDDEFDIAFHEASESHGFLCERADMAVFTGDVMEWVRERIETSCGLIGLLNSSNPNVFLEIGYAWAKGIPTILVLKKGHEAPFNVKSQRFIEYERINDLRKKMTTEIGALKRQGVFVQRRLA